MNIGDPKAHLALKLVWILVVKFLEGTTTAQTTPRPARLTTLIGH
jgi:hypothetical protein